MLEKCEVIQIHGRLEKFQVAQQPEASGAVLWGRAPGVLSPPPHPPPLLGRTGTGVYLLSNLLGSKYLGIWQNETCFCHNVPSGGKGAGGVGGLWTVASLWSGVPIFTRKPLQLEHTPRVGGWEPGLILEPVPLSPVARRL